MLDKYGRVDISIHVPIAGNDLRGASVFHRGILFQSTFPLQGTTSIFLFNLFRCIISIHVPIAGNDCEAGYIKQGKVISIHVPIAGNDGERHRKRVERKISIHVPIAGNDACGNEVIDYLHIFQSTFPLQGTTMLICSSIHSSQYFNPRSHCRERLNAATRAEAGENISIHVPIAGNDRCYSEHCQKRDHFNPRSHCRERRYA